MSDHCKFCHVTIRQIVIGATVGWEHVDQVGRGYRFCRGTTAKPCDRTDHG